MNILLGFAPFLVFALLDRLFGSIEGLIAGTVMSAILVGRELMVGHRSPKILEIGTLLLFGGLALYAVLMRPDWSMVGVRLRVDVGLLAIVLLSIALRRPFTLQYAREQADRTGRETAGFIRANYAISSAWAAAFAVLVAADVLMMTRPDVPLRVGIIATIAALYAAVKFTAWYPDHLAKAARV